MMRIATAVATRRLLPAGEPRTSARPAHAGDSGCRCSSARRTSQLALHLRPDATPVLTTRRLSPWLYLVPGALCFLVLGVRLSDGLPTWHEEVSIQSNLGYRVLPDEVRGAASGTLPVGPWCGDPAPPRWVVSRGRPTLSLCVAGRSLPVMTMSYASGIFAWPFIAVEPLHHDDVFVQRKIGLVRGLLALILLFSMVRYIADDTTAGLAAFLAGVSAPFLYPHVLLFPYETLPWTLVAAAFWVWSGARELAPSAPRDGPPPSWSRMLTGGAILGLAVLANVKAVFIVPPLLLAAMLAGARFRRIRPAQWAALILTAIVACAPMWVFGLVDPAAGLSGQFRSRLSMLAHKARPGAMLSEARNLLTFGSDVGFYLEQVGGKPGTSFIPGLVVVAPAIAWAWFCAASRIVGRPKGSMFAATCGLLLLAYYFVSLLLYDQYPSANYAPMHCVFGATYAAFAVDAGSGIASLLRRMGVVVRAAIPTAAIAAVIACVLVAATLRRGDPSVYMVTSINAVAERSAARYLVDHPARGEIITTSYNLAGVIDVLGAERVHPIQAHILLERCRGRERDALFACVEDRLRWILGHDGSLPMRFLLPSVITGADTPLDVNGVVSAALVQAASERGLALSVETAFTTRGGDEVMRLYRVAHR